MKLSPNRKTAIVAIITFVVTQILPYPGIVYAENSAVTYNSTTGTYTPVVPYDPNETVTTTTTTSPTADAIQSASEPSPLSLPVTAESNPDIEVIGNISNVTSMTLEEMRQRIEISHGFGEGSVKAFIYKESSFNSQPAVEVFYRLTVAQGENTYQNATMVFDTEGQLITITWGQNNPPADELPFRVLGYEQLKADYPEITLPDVTLTSLTLVEENETYKKYSITYRLATAGGIRDVTFKGYRMGVGFQNYEILSLTAMQTDLSRLEVFVDADSFLTRLQELGKDLTLEQVFQTYYYAGEARYYIAQGNDGRIAAAVFGDILFQNPFDPPGELTPAKAGEAVYFVPGGDVVRVADRRPDMSPGNAPAFRGIGFNENNDVLITLYSDSPVLDSMILREDGITRIFPEDVEFMFAGRSFGSGLYGTPTVVVENDQYMILGFKLDNVYSVIPKDPAIEMSGGRLDMHLVTENPADYTVASGSFLTTPLSDTVVELTLKNGQTRYGVINSNGLVQDNGEILKDIDERGTPVGEPGLTVAIGDLTYVAQRGSVTPPVTPAVIQVYRNGELLAETSFGDNQIDYIQALSNGDIQYVSWYGGVAHDLNSNLQRIVYTDLAEDPGVVAPLSGERIYQETQSSTLPKEHLEALMGGSVYIMMPASERVVAGDQILNTPGYFQWTTAGGQVQIFKYTVHAPNILPNYNDNELRYKMEIWDSVTQTYVASLELTYTLEGNPEDPANRYPNYQVPANPSQMIYRADGLTDGYDISVMPAAEKEALYRTLVQKMLNCLTDDRTPPVITAPVISDVTAGGATVQATTDEPAYFQVFYSTDPGFPDLTRTAWTTTLSTSLSQALTGLEDQTLYYVKVKVKDASNNWTFSDMITFQTQELPLPEGWTRAASNRHFAFHEKVERVGQYYQYTLQLMDLVTSQIQNLASAMPPYAYLSSAYDVSPDGNTVIYGTGGSLQPDGTISHTVHVQRIANSAEKITLKGGLQSIIFNPDGTATLDTTTLFPSGTVIGDTYEVRLDTLQASEAVSRIVTAGAGLHIDLDTPLVIQPERFAGGYYKALIYDASQGAAQLHLLTILDITSDASGRGYTFIDAYTTPSGRQVVSIGLDSSTSNTGMIVDPRTGETIRLNGAITAATYSLNIATYTVVTQGGITYQAKLNLDTLQFTSVPHQGMLQIVDDFYQGTAPNATLSSWVEVKNSSGVVIGWNVTVKLNQSTQAGAVQNQLLMIRQVASKWVMKEVRDRDYKNSLIYRSVFYYNSTAQLTKINRYNRLGTRLSTVYVRRPSGGTPYYEIVTVTGKKKVLSFSTPYYLVLLEAAQLAG